MTDLNINISHIGPDIINLAPLDADAEISHQPHIEGKTNNREQNSAFNVFALGKTCPGVIVQG